LVNKLGEYLYWRINNDQEKLARSRPRNMNGLYITKKDLQRYVWDYFNIGLDETGIKSFEEEYWDRRDEEY
jgi:hypothetical protein